MEGFVRQREVSAYLLASDILVMPYSSWVTRRDGTEAGEFTSPLKLFEYMTAGKPIVATGVPSVLEILWPGENLVVTPPDDAEGFIEALGLPLGDLGALGGISSGSMRMLLDALTANLPYPCDRQDAPT